MHNLVLMPYSSTFINARLIIASILLQMELPMRKKVECLLSCLMYLGGHFQQRALTNQNFSIKKYPEVPRCIPCHSEGLKTSPAEVGTYQLSSIFIQLRQFPLYPSAGVAHSSLDSLHGMTNSLSLALKHDNNFGVSNKPLCDSVVTNQFFSHINGQLPLYDFPARLNSLISYGK